jgi:hypothetical protein
VSTLYVSKRYLNYIPEANAFIMMSAITSNTGRYNGFTRREADERVTIEKEDTFSVAFKSFVHKGDV